MFEWKGRMLSMKVHLALLQLLYYCIYMSSHMPAPAYIRYLRLPPCITKMDVSREDYWLSIWSVLVPVLLLLSRWDDWMFICPKCDSCSFKLMVCPWLYPSHFTVCEAPQESHPNLMSMHPHMRYGLNTGYWKVLICTSSPVGMFTCTYIAFFSVQLLFVYTRVFWPHFMKSGELFFGVV